MDGEQVNFSNLIDIDELKELFSDFSDNRQTPKSYQEKDWRDKQGHKPQRAFDLKILNVRCLVPD